MLSTFNPDKVLPHIAMLTMMDYQKEESEDFPFDIHLGTWDDVLDASNWPDVRHKKNGYGKMRWKNIFKRQKFKSKRFICSIRCKTSKKALALFAGRMSPNDVDGKRVSIDYIERSHNAQMLKGHAIALAIKFAYLLCKALTFDFVRVSNPAPGLIDVYRDEMPNSKYITGKKQSYIIAPRSL